MQLGFAYAFQSGLDCSERSPGQFHNQTRYALPSKIHSTLMFGLLADTRFREAFTLPLYCSPRS